MNSRGRIALTMAEKHAEPCACRGLHVYCQACPQQQFAKQVSGEYDVTFEDLQSKAAAGCATCAVIRDELNLPEIKRAWLASIRPAIESGRRAGTDLSKLYSEMSGNVESVAEKFVRLTILPRADTHERVVIRTFASSKSNDWRHFNFNASKLRPAISCTPFAPLSYFPVDNTESKTSFQHLRSWLESCDSSHTCYAQTPALLPKRVLRIAADRVFLHLSKAGERARYTTLSYRWGEHESLTLTARNLDHLVRGIALSDLPKTSQNAVNISRKIGVSYLWIDALCIVQTDEDDWKEQSMKMCDVYGGSYLNIAANDSVGSEGGCFRSGDAAKRSPAFKVSRDRDVVVRQQPHFTHHDFGSNYRIHSGTAPLLKRSWVLQERLLSARVVYYGKDELVWECREASDCQCGGITTLSRFKEYFHTSLKRGDPLSFAWMRISERYSSTDISYDSDRAIALSGIAQHAYHSGRGGRYLAGMWERDLAHQLCWKISDQWRKPTEYLAPSWSWLSISGSISYCNRLDFSASASQIDVKITEVSCTSTAEDGSGVIQSGYLKINGRALEVQAEIQSFVRGERPQYHLVYPEQKLRYNDFRPDYIMEPKAAIDITALTIIYWGKMWPHQTTFMVLKKDGHAESPSYQRMGLISLVDEDERLSRAIIDACVPVVDLQIV